MNNASPNHEDIELALRERVKELTCLYGIAQLADRPGISLEDILKGIVALLPPAWRHPRQARARIVLDKTTYESAPFETIKLLQKSNIMVKNRRRGSVEVGYVEDRRITRPDPFLREEDSLINEIARQIGFIVERREVEAARSALEQQLRHADRLATIGQLAAGIAHELNEPLGSILGFAQLMKKNLRLPEREIRDLTKIESAALHAREIIRKLNTFARPAPPQERMVDLNSVVKEEIDFWQSRCEKNDIRLSCELAPDSPRVIGDPGQLKQVLVNILVNAVQAMPDGGTLTIRTEKAENAAHIMVTDTGMGMSSSVVERIFDPFFTTKDVDEGTGLGLSVVHGIVTAHGGCIEVHSVENRGSSFTVRLPLAGESLKDGGSQ